jgi:hypothetical protein
MYRVQNDYYSASRMRVSPIYTPQTMPEDEAWRVSEQGMKLLRRGLGRRSTATTNKRGVRLGASPAWGAAQGSGKTQIGCASADGRGAGSGGTVSKRMQ